MSSRKGLDRGNEREIRDLRVWMRDCLEAMNDAVRWGDGWCSVGVMGIGIGIGVGVKGFIGGVLIGERGWDWDLVIGESFLELWIGCIRLVVDLDFRLLGLSLGLRLRLEVIELIRVPTGVAGLGIGATVPVGVSQVVMI